MGRVRARVTGQRKLQIHNTLENFADFTKGVIEGKIARITSCNRVALNRQYISFVCCMLDGYRTAHGGNDRVTHRQVAQRRWSKIIMTKSRIKNIRMRKPAAGMARLFSQSNRVRYRKLASGMISQAEQHQLLDDLAEEMEAFATLAAASHLQPRTASSLTLVTQYDRQLCLGDP
jgi:hypothetical protein